MNKIYFITGASGSGKTTTLKLLEEENKKNFAFCYFDSVGVPSGEEMEKQYGSGENWQKSMILFWVKEMKEKYLDQTPTILDGQMRISFIDEACKQNGVNEYVIILFDCSDMERTKRLIKRGHPELANPDMFNWAKYLRNEATNRGAIIIDTSNFSIEESKKTLLETLQ